MATQTLRKSAGSEHRLPRQHVQASTLRDSDPAFDPSKSLVLGRNRLAETDAVGARDQRGNEGVERVMASKVSIAGTVREAQPVVREDLFRQ